MAETHCKPVFVQSLMDTTVNEGQKLKLHAAINAQPEPEVKQQQHPPPPSMVLSIAFL